MKPKETTAEFNIQHTAEAVKFAGNRGPSGLYVRSGIFLFDIISS
jgi:hypothetical protein